MPSTSKAVRRLVAVTLLALALPATASAAAPNVTSMVVSRAGILMQPKTVSAHSFTIPVGSRRCAIAEGTPLAALKATGIVFHVKDFARCSTVPSTSSGLFVDRILTTTNKGTSGWSFKVNNLAATAGAADSKGPFGTGPLADGDKVVWFWCVFDSNWACQRNLVVSAPASAAPGSTVTVTVSAIDDFGGSIPASRAKVSVGSVTAITASDGSAQIKLPSTGATASIRAVDGIAASARYVQRVPSFPHQISLSAG